MSDIPETLFRTIGLIGKYCQPNTSEQVRDRLSGELRKVLDFLEDRGITVLPDTSAAKALNSQIGASPVTPIDREMIGKQSDLLVVVGGDGTMLNAARDLAHHEVPIMGINLGRLGFLADISPDNVAETLTDIFNGQYRTEQRFLLRAKIQRQDAVVMDAVAMNDVVIHKWGVARMLEFATHINGQFVNHHRADGLIVATPTGSTAYALSGGGPLLAPGLEALNLVPICPHTLSDRPIVVPSSSCIEVHLKDDPFPDARVTLDGQVNYALECGDRIQIERLPGQLTMIHPANYDYFSILRAKLHWGNRPG